MNEACINRGEAEERAYLVRVRTAIRAGLDQVGGAVSTQHGDVVEMKKYLQDSICSEEILIISPNQVFAHYISQVLPELGEEMIKETTMEALAAHLLDPGVRPGRRALLQRDALSYARGPAHASALLNVPA